MSAPNRRKILKSAIVIMKDFHERLLFSVQKNKEDTEVVVLAVIMNLSERYLILWMIIRHFMRHIIMLQVLHAFGDLLMRLTN